MKFAALCMLLSSSCVVALENTDAENDDVGIPSHLSSDSSSIDTTVNENAAVDLCILVAYSVLDCML